MLQLKFNWINKTIEPIIALRADAHQLGIGRAITVDVLQNLSEAIAATILPFMRLFKRNEPEKKAQIDCGRSVQEDWRDFRIIACCHPQNTASLQLLRNTLNLEQQRGLSARAGTKDLRIEFRELKPKILGFCGNGKQSKVFSCKEEARKRIREISIGPRYSNFHSCTPMPPNNKKSRPHKQQTELRNQVLTTPVTTHLIISDQYREKYGLARLADIDLASTQPGGWLTDNALMWSVAFFDQENPQLFSSSCVISPSIMELIKQQHAELQLLRHELHDNITQLLLPTNLDNYHWVLLRVTRGELGVSCQLYDSLPQSDEQQQFLIGQLSVAIVVQLLSSLSNSAPVWSTALMSGIIPQVIAIPRQLNGSDCGVCVFEWIRRLVGEAEVSVDQGGRDNTRAWMASVVNESFVPAVATPAKPHLEDLSDLLVLPEDLVNLLSLPNEDVSTLLSEEVILKLLSLPDEGDTSFNNK